MIPVQGEPPKIDFKLPKKWKKFFNSLRDFCIQIQPVNGNGVKLDQLPKGRRLTVDVAEVVAADAAEANFPLKLIEANTSTLAKVRVVLGYVGGFKADTSMSISDSPVFTKTLSSAGTHYIYAELTVAYSATVGVWQVTASTVATNTTFPSATSTKAYVLLGTATVATSGAVLAVTSVSSQVSGSQSFQRLGNATTYSDSNTLQ